MFTSLQRLLRYISRSRLFRQPTRSSLHSNYRYSSSLHLPKAFSVSCRWLENLRAKANAHELNRTGWLSLTATTESLLQDQKVKASAAACRENTETTPGGAGLGQSWLRFERTQKLRLHEGRQHRCGPLAKQMTSACGFGPVTDSVVGTQLIRHKPCQQLE